MEAELSMYRRLTGLEQVAITNGPARPAWIGLFDILGFEALNEFMDGNDLAVLLEGIPSQLEHRLKWNPSEMHVEFTMYSDSILLYSMADFRRPNTLVGLASAGAALITTCAANGIPLRGALTKGDFWMTPPWVSDNPEGTIRGQQIWGKAFLRAYHLERAQDWVGGLVDLDGELTEVDRIALKIAQESGVLADYTIPLKQAAKSLFHQPPLALNWPATWDGPPESIRRRILGLGAQPEAARGKLAAAAEFYTWSKANVKIKTD